MFAHRAIAPIQVGALKSTKDSGSYYHGVNGAFGYSYFQGSDHWQNVRSPSLEILPQISGAHNEDVSPRLLLPPRPTSLEDLLRSFQASMELDHMGLRLLEVLMPVIFLVYDLL